MSNNYIAAPAINCDISRRYYERLAQKQQELADLESKPGALPAVQFIQQRRALIESISEMKETWAKDQAKIVHGST